MCEVCGVVFVRVRRSALHPRVRRLSPTAANVIVAWQRLPGHVNLTVPQRSHFPTLPFVS
jgi:hypothetical protein